MIRRALTIVIASAVTPTVAAAYSDPAMFGAPVDVGGGGGRLFTGSVHDGLSCAVCHAGGSRVPLVVEGLPLSGYVRGAHYELTITWSDAVTHAGLAVEVTDTDGRAAGTLLVPEGDQLLASELCIPSGARVPAASVEHAPDERSVVMVADCGARQVRMLWTAPDDPRQAAVRLSGAFVKGDGSGDVQGDGVTILSRLLHPVAEPTPLRTHAACAAIEPGRSRAACVGWLFLLLAMLLGLGRSRRCRR